ncbi:TonB-dependent receptor plug domain-containing protein [Sphingomonas sp. ACRSK]|uniref:TonB-dependent receptor plug domain-containing protein n=1 Tax=Sphingomonas sp. ACRSK TaxID=2918213 RepID=UPI001EF6BD71|nr:TonB-dependent receptor [Sphingomonas sp. ACRSK]MCG7347349.1 TonB-dependent receptor [Sphingomonas sp. ACRSK]
MRQSHSSFRATVAYGAMLMGLFMAPGAAAQNAAPGGQTDNLPIPSVPEAQAETRGADGADNAPGDIVVTGSRIRRPDFESPSPVVTIGAATLQQSGTTNLTDFLTGLPALQGSSTSADNSGSGAGIGYTGLNLLNLRNLGTQRTLVLIDGRRQVATVPGTQAIDINTIPNDLVERIDILTGGESAIYGADAVTGVVNFVLKKNFEGITARAQAGISEYGDAGKRLFSVTAGKNFADGRGNIAVAYEYGEESRLESRDRKNLRGAALTGFYRNPADPEFQSGYTGGASNGIPDRVPTTDIRYNDTAREGAIDVDFDGVPDLLVNGRGQLVPFDVGTVVQPGYSTGGSGTRVADYQNDLLPDIKRHVVNAIARFEVSPALELFLEGKYANNKAFSLGQPSFDYYLLQEGDNAFLPGALAGGDGVLVTRDNFDIGQRGESITRETIRTVVGARGDLSSHANYEVSYTFGQSKITSDYVNDVFDDRFLAAIDAVRGPDGQITCRVNLDPSWLPNQPYTDRYTGAPATFAPGECVPLNLFGDGAPSQAALDFVRANTRDRSRLRQHVVTASLAGDFGKYFELPGGPIGFALGGEYRKEESRFVPDELAAQGLTFTNALGREEGEFDVKEAFAELNVPLLRDRPFFHRLELGAAIRFSDYSTIGSTTTWKANASWAPVRDITFNGTYSKAVRAPNIGELFGGLSQTFDFITDPCDRAEIQNGTQYRAANCQALLSGLGVTDPANYVDARSSNIPGFSGGNPDLDAEKSRAWTAGFVVQPRFIPGLSFRADWYDIKLKGAINTVTATELAQLCVDQPTTDNQFCDLITRTNVDTGTADRGNITSFTVLPQNVARFQTAGLDINANYQFDTGSFGRFNLRVVANYLDKLEFFGTPGADATNSCGETLAPKYTFNGDLTWSMGPVTLNYGLTWFDKTLRFTNLVTQSNPDVVAPEYLYLKELWQHDIYASVDVGDSFQFYGGVNNVFGQKPELATSSYPVSSVGRYIFAGARVKFGDR